MKLHTLLGVALGAVLLATGAQAATYEFFFQGPSSSAYGDVVIDGTFTTATPLTAGGGSVFLTGISGTVSGGSSSIVDGAIVGLSPYADADNELYATGTNTGAPYSFGGVSFTVTTSTRTADYNLFGWNGVTNLLVSTIDPVGEPQNSTPAALPFSPGSITASVSAAPEPATWAMMLIGVGGLGAVLRHSGRKARASIAAA